MVEGGLFGRTFSILKRSLDLITLNHRIISMNVANVNTPNYRPIALRFDEALRFHSSEMNHPQLIRTHEKHMPSLLQVQYQEAGPFIHEEVSYEGPDGNSVDEEKEMVRLAENQLMYHALVQVLTRQFNAIKDAIREGGR